jgi:hypothetical protein
LDIFSYAMSPVAPNGLKRLMQLYGVLEDVSARPESLTEA